MGVSVNKVYCCDELKKAEYFYISYFDKEGEDGWAIEGINGAGNIFPAHFMKYCLFCGTEFGSTNKE